VIFLPSTFRKVARYNNVSVITLITVIMMYVVDNVVTPCSEHSWCDNIQQINQSINLYLYQATRAYTYKKIFYDVLHGFWTASTLELIVRASDSSPLDSVQFCSQPIRTSQLCHRTIFLLVFHEVDRTGTGGCGFRNFCSFVIADTRVMTNEFRFIFLCVFVTWITWILTLGPFDVFILLNGWICLHGVLD